MDKKRNFLIYSLALLALAFSPAAVWADDAGLPVTHGSIIRDTARITFEWPEPVHFNAHANGKTLSVTFNRNANPDFGAMLSELYPYVTSAERENDGRTIVLTLEKPYSIRTFISDGLSGVELLRIDPAERQALHADDAALVKTAENAHILGSLTPSAGDTTTKTAPATPAQQTTAAAQPAKQAPAAAQNDSAAISPAEEAKLAAAAPSSNEIKVSVSPAEDSAVLRFPFTQRTAAAVFMRSNTLWIVFNQKVKLDLSDFDSMPQTVIGKAAVLQDAKTTILRVPVDNAVFARAEREEGKFEWAVLVMAQKHSLEKALKIEINTDPPAPANVFIPVLEMADPVTVMDPSIGDSLVVVPMYNPGEGVAIRRDFVEFSLLQTAEGVVVAKKADEVAATEIRDGLRIAMPEGATLTPGLPDVQAAEHAEVLENNATLFPYSQWKADDSAPEREQISDLLHRIVESDTPIKASDARLRLAQIYLSEGMTVEALGMLAGIERTDPVYYRSAKLAAMRGAAEFLMYRFADAARDFAAPELGNSKEAGYWRNMLSDLLGNPAKYDYLAMNKDYISQYPPPFRQRLAIVAADHAITGKEYNTALKIFDSLHDSNLLDPISSYVSFLTSKIAADNGQEKDAVDAWDKLAEDYTHPFVRARAELSRILWGMDHTTLTKPQAVDRLERLRLAWHGDALEMEVLKLLGDLYAEKKDFINAMRIWNDGVTSFPDTSLAVDMSHKMEGAFIAMFNEGGADSLPTLDALTIYYQYRDYAPSGGTSNDMINKLADRLVAVDLLDQAALLLDHQMRFQMEKEKRSRIGARLATIYLLNHQPKQALESLENSVYGENPSSLRVLRNRLASEAMSELGQTDKALQLLGSDDAVDSEQVRLNIYWQQRDWAHVVDTAETILRGRKDITAPLSVDESETVLRLALGYVFQDNPTQLQYLRDYFGPLMAQNPNKAVFDFITAPDVAPDPTNFDTVINNLSLTRSFIDGYKARIQKSGLGSVMAGNTTPPASTTAPPQAKQ